MTEKTVGISDIALYVPANRLPLETLRERRAEESPQLASRLSGALGTTGQKALRFPDPWEDTATMAAEAALTLLEDSPWVRPQELRFIGVGTETTLDLAKPASAYVQGMLQQARVPIVRTLSSFQVQHACAAGTLALMAVAAQLHVGGRDSESGLVICSDVARYEARTTAEITQGAGAAALLVQNDPRLLELDLQCAGLCSRDVDDFFRPLGSATAKVRGGFSLQCYTEALELAFLDHCHRRGESAEEILLSTDMLALHAPFHNMPEMAVQRLLNRILGMGTDAARAFLRQRGFYAGIAPVAQVGNIYSGSLYLCLKALLADRYRSFGEEIAGRSVLVASYGSGNTMVVLSGRVADSAPTVIQRWAGLPELEAGREASWEEYERWMHLGEDGRPDLGGEEDADSRRGRFFLSAVREDGYRLYGLRPTAMGTGDSRLRTRSLLRT